MAVYGLRVKNTVFTIINFDFRNSTAAVLTDLEGISALPDSECTCMLVFQFANRIFMSLKTTYSQTGYIPLVNTDYPSPDSGPSDIIDTASKNTIPQNSSNRTT